MYQDFLPYSLAYVKLQKTVLCVFSSFFILFGGLDNIQSQEKPFVVVLDAGHGGHDSGNRGNGYFEKKIALSIALKIGKILEKINDFKIIYTRKSDVFVDLIERANIANKADADLFVSIHCDAFTSPKAFGAGTFVLGLHENERNFKVAQKENSVIFLEKDYEKNYDGFNPNDPESVISLILMQQTYLEQSIDVASTIQKSFVNNLSRKDRTVKQAGFIVLKYTYMPSVLVETGFLTNKKEGAYLNSKKGQTEMSKSIAKGILKYRNSINSDLVNNDSQLFSDLDNNYTDKYFLKIQIASSSKKVPLKSYNFKGLGNLSYLKNNNTYRYYFERTQDYTLAKLMLKRAVKSGYKDALIVAFKNDKSITIEEYLSSYKK